MSGNAAGFDAYWSRVLGELADIPASPELERLPLRETDFACLYGVRFSGIGPYRLFGYLSIPKGRGPFPAIYWAPPYGSVQEIIPQGTANEVRSRFLTFSPAHRGQRTADRPFAAMFPGLLTHRIDSSDRYVFRGVVADAVRGLQYLSGRPELDRDRLVAVGNDLALQAVALSGLASHLVCTPNLFLEPLAAAARTRSYPLEEYSDYLRRFPARRSRVADTLALFELLRFAPAVSVPALLVAGPEGSLRDAPALARLENAMGGETTTYQSRNSNYLDGVAVERWVAGELASGSPILPRHWT